MQVEDRHAIMCIETLKQRKERLRKINVFFSILRRDIHYTANVGIYGIDSLHIHRTSHKNSIMFLHTYILVKKKEE